MAIAVYSYNCRQHTTVYSFTCIYVNMYSVYYTGKYYAFTVLNIDLHPFRSALLR